MLWFWFGGLGACLLWVCVVVCAFCFGFADGLVFDCAAIWVVVEFSVLVVRMRVLVVCRFWGFGDLGCPWVFCGLDILWG